MAITSNYSRSNSHVVISSRAANRIGIAVVTVLVGGVYFATMHPGMVDFDGGELQTMATLLGVCHAPGYALTVLLGWLFTRLPFGPTEAWRINLMMVVMGSVSALALYGAVRRITGRVMPALTAAGLLAFSAAIWKLSIAAEVYSFHTAALTTTIYCLARFKNDRDIGLPGRAWLYLSALGLGVCCGGRPSELLIVPAFLTLWFVNRGQLRLGWRQWLVCIALGVVPFAAGIGFYLWRNDPALVTARDDSLRDEWIDGTVPFTQRDWYGRLKLAVWHCSGFKWADMLRARPATFESDLRKLAWILSGADVVGERFPGNSEHDVQMRLEQGRGTVLGPLGLGLVLLGLLSLRKRGGWVLLGLGIAAGNLSFYFLYHTFDNLDFISPAIVGLALVSGLGAEWLTSRRTWGGIPEVLVLAAPLMLLAANYRVLDQSGPRREEILRNEYELSHVRLPRDAVILTSFKSASMYRYLFWVYAKRTDVHVVIFHGRHTTEQVKMLSEKLWNRFGAVYVPAYNVPADVRTVLASRTPPEIRQYGLVVNTAK